MSICTFNKIYDISILMGADHTDYPGDTPYTRESTCSIIDGGFCNLSKLGMSTHSGTHLDAFYHFIDDGNTIDSYDLEKFVLPAHVVEIADGEAVRPDELEHLEVKPGDALLFKTQNSLCGRSRSGRFSEDYVFVTPACADFCIEKQVSLVALDYITVEKYGDMSFPVHRKLLGNKILILEGVDLMEVTPAKYTLICFPLKIEGSDGSPVRAVLVQ